MTGGESDGGERSGLLLALAGFALLSLGDAVVKSMAGQWAPSAIATLRYAIGASGLAALLYAREGRGGFVLHRPGLQLVRGASVSLATIAFFSALTVMPLAEATTIVFVSPLITGLLAPLFLKEPSRLRTWIASGVAFVGVMIVLRPNFAALGWAALLPLGSAVGMSGLMMANRAVMGRTSALAMQASVALVAAPIMLAATVAGHFSAIGALAVGVPSAIVIAKCAVVALTASSAHWLIYLGTTRAGAATIAPMTYVQLIVATTVGWLWFGDRPDATTLLGAAVIIGAGLYLWRAGQGRREPAEIP
ncbi:DMT family transporter [Tsuneonella amylolytica]|uniref:DMT family transporter n=1 Tax=Tsuneonella amylolytica TaxID=2338327 RepID=UPI000EAA04FD|nr:DMT family transporter [Tsuneonella amylolytica]